MSDPEIPQFLPGNNRAPAPGRLDGITIRSFPGTSPEGHGDASSFRMNAEKTQPIVGITDLDDADAPEADAAARRAHRDVNVEVASSGALTEDGQALLFAEHGAHFRYVASWSRWMVYSGGRWQPEKTLLIFDRIRKQVRLATENAKPGVRTRLCAKRSIAAIETLARSDRRLAATTEQWDSDIWALNTPEGVVDLKSGSIRPHRLDDFCMKTTAVGPGGDCPKFLAFLDQIFDKDQELIDYIQKMFGYCLTGSIREHALFFGFGTGGNGKGVLLGAMNGILGSYARIAPMETFVATHQSGHPTDLAGFAGARFVSASETEEGRKWAEAKVKALTGGDPISARFMRQDFFDFAPTFKLFVTGNHKPGLRGVDESIRRRFHLIPFAVSIPQDEQDRRLPEKLKEEWCGILAWAIEGARKWCEEGLDRPAAVSGATNDYLEAEDTLATWLDECCELNANYRTPRAQLFASWKAWAERGGEFVGSQKQLFEKLENRGFQPSKDRDGTRTFLGVRLKLTERGEHCDLY
ncbi:MAG: phage/plasmid primase, P4 family [Methylocella sp.]